MQDKTVFVGTSGYSYSDWIGEFYPYGIPKNQMLAEYSKRFKTVEINSSFYSLIGRQFYSFLVRNTPADFSFFIKAHKSVSHDRKGAGDFLSAISFLKTESKFKGVLIQFPFSFKLNRKNFFYLESVLTAFFREKIPTAVEFRHSSWYVKGTAEILHKYRATFVAVDEPELPNLPPKTAPITNPSFGYIRFHSRNAGKWWKGDKERYDYLYSKNEMAEWIPKIKKLLEKTESVFVYFNNCQKASAVKNAEEFREMLRSENINAV